MFLRISTEILHDVTTFDVRNSSEIVEKRADQRVYDIQRIWAKAAQQGAGQSQKALRSPSGHFNRVLEHVTDFQKITGLRSIYKGRVEDAPPKGIHDNDDPML